MVHYGGYAEEVVALATLVYFIPNSIGYTAAAVFPTSSSTSHIGICDKLKLQAGKTILIHGAAGGVGLTAVEIAKKVAATVIATAGGPKKLAIAKQHGADHLIDYRTEDIRTRVKALTDGRGVEGVYDLVGGDVFTALLRATAQQARILVVGFTSGTVAPVSANILLVKSISVHSFLLGRTPNFGPRPVIKLI